jgi:hypothetical protein
MNEEIRLLRDALEATLEMLSEVDESEDVQGQVRFALNVTSGRLPKGYGMTWYPPRGKWEAWKDETLLLEDAAVKWFDSEFAARLFCWQHAQVQSEERAS